MRYTNILFDFDGTLADSAPGIRNGVAYALKTFGEPVDYSTLNDFIGPPLVDSFMKKCGCSRERALEMLWAYREYYEKEGLMQTERYPGVEEMLGALKAAGFTLMVATSKPEKYALALLQTLGLLKYFDFVAGSNMDETRTHKDEVIRYLLDSRGIGGEALRHTLMVGDRAHDVLGAGACGIDCLGVLYGYGTREELLEAGAAYIAERPNDVVSLLLSLG